MERTHNPNGFLAQTGSELNAQNAATACESSLLGQFAVLSYVWKSEEAKLRPGERRLIMIFEVTLVLFIVKVQECELVSYFFSFWVFDM